MSEKKKIHWSQEEAHGGLCHARNGMTPGYLCQSATYGLGRRVNVDAPTKVSDARYCAQCLLALQLLGIDKAYAARISSLSTRILDEQCKKIREDCDKQLRDMDKRLTDAREATEKANIDARDAEVGKAARTFIRSLGQEFVSGMYRRDGPRW